ncbi:MAG: hypothetical protein JXN65_10350 [Clostridia bacterium]|nr:hypothetical protein [Clostridia bacterium]
MNVLLVEPSYKNKYPPMGLMKISKYHKVRGDIVIFYKGEMDKDKFCNYKFDRIYITTLFTFNYKQTVKTIKYYENLLPASQIYIGGIMTTLLNKRLCGEINNKINIITGLLTDSSKIGFADKVNIDTLPLDYSILDLVEYKYPSGDNYFAYITRGCTNKCKFCAVPILEPNFCLTNNIKGQIKNIKEEYGEKQNLLLLDNNILSLEINDLSDVVNDIYELGFDKKTKFYLELPFNEYMKKLKKSKNDGYTFDNILNELIIYLKQKQSIQKSKIYDQKYKEILSDLESTDDKYLVIEKNENILREILTYYHRPSGRERYVDFNQGIDARQLTREKMSILSKIPIRPFRLAFDDIHYSKIYTEALKLAAEFGVQHFSNYLLYNYKDKPVDLWKRLKLNIDLGKELNVRIFSFPMKYAPIDRIDRNYVGQNWNKHYLSNIRAITNVTKGVVAGGENFFYKAFGANEEEYLEILSMPKEFVIYRKNFEDIGLTKEWQSKYKKLSFAEKEDLIVSLSLKTEPTSKKIKSIMKYYTIRKEDYDG